MYSYKLKFIEMNFNQIIFKKLFLQLAFIASLFLVLFSCSSENSTNSSAVSSQKLEGEKLVGFENIASSQSNITFINQLDINTVKSPMEYINSYNGGGVTVADFNNDGLDDIYFTGNLVDNKLYLNKGDFKFEDITEKAGVACKGAWSTGATVGDVNNDGWLDIYVGQSYYDKDEDKRRNVLFMNNGDLTFTNKAKEYGIDIPHYTIQSAFLDADRDGDLDLYVGNTPLQRTGQERGTHQKFFKNPVMEFSDQYFENNGNGKFINKTKEAGFLNYGWMLGVSVADYNEDGWQDIYVAVDHSEPDLLMINNKNGTFTNQIDSKMKHISSSSMGTDAVDINNDGYQDLISLDMLSVDNYNEKTQMGSMNPEEFWKRVDFGYHYQYMRNMLQLNVGDGNFSEIGQMAKLHRTDWSWAVLGADFDNNGWNDLYITNGYYRGVMDKDMSKKFTQYMNKFANDRQMQINTINAYPKQLKPQKSKNALYTNNGDLSFELRQDLEGVSHYGFSSGATYADLDNDGDLDLVVNNIDEQASIIKNLQSDNSSNSYLTVDFESKKHVPITGSKVRLEIGEDIFLKEFTFSRGYQSSVPDYLHFGLGGYKNIDKLMITWFDGKTQTLSNVKTNQRITLKYEDATQQNSNAVANSETLFKKKSNVLQTAYTHVENPYDDYKKQVLLPHKMSQFGPFVSKGDLNKDGNEEIHIGGSAGKPGVIYSYNAASGNYSMSNFPSISQDAKYEDMGSVFFDANGDGNLDLYVVSGGNEFEIGSQNYQDRLYLNNGDNTFKKTKGMIPPMAVSGSCVKASDFDNDGDIDLFVGGRQEPGKYPFPASSMLLENNKGVFKEVSKDKAKGFDQLGMVTDASWEDIDGDGDKDLVVVGEWMQIKIFENESGFLEDKSDRYNLEHTKGWWNCIKAEDIDNDGDMDFVLGNLGTNYKYQATVEEPFHVYAGDVDENGKYDIVLGQYNQNTLFPVRGRQCSSEQIPEIAEKFPTYHDFGKATLADVYGEELNTMLHLEVNNFKSGILLNNGSGKLEFKAFDNYAQIAPINQILIEDVDLDGHKDLITAGNFYASEVETGRADAGYGLVLKGDGKGNFTSMFGEKSGMFLDKDVRDLEIVNMNDSRLLIATTNNDNLEILEFAKKKKIN